MTLDYSVKIYYTKKEDNTYELFNKELNISTNVINLDNAKLTFVSLLKNKAIEIKAICNLQCKDCSRNLCDKNIINFIKILNISDENLINEIILIKGSE